MTAARAREEGWARQWWEVRRLRSISNWESFQRRYLAVDVSAGGIFRLAAGRDPNPFDVASGVELGRGVVVDIIRHRFGASPHSYLLITEVGMGGAP